MTFEDDELRQSLDRLETLDALQIAYERRSELMAIVGDSASADEAQNTLQAEWGLSYVQAVCALDIQMRRFSGQERGRLDEERTWLQHRIEQLRDSDP